MKTAWALLRETWAEWVADHGSRLSAALSYYAIFSIAPLLLLTLSIAGRVFGEHSARAELFETTKRFLGPSTAKAISEILQAASQTASATATVVGAVLLLYAASGVFASMTDALNFIFRCPEYKISGIRMFMRERAISLLLVLATFLVTIALILTSIWLSAASRFSSQYIRQDVQPWQVVEALITFLLVAGSFGALYLWVPATGRVKARCAFAGGAFAALLFSIVKAVFSIYISRFNPASAYGAAGSLVVILLLIYFSSQIFFLGAEFAKVVSRHIEQKELELAV